ncbi:MAG TPA: 30S ribosomal protein S6 [Geobacteraceae bacterium]
MEQIWKKYETLVLYNGAMDLPAAEQMLEKLREIVRSGGGKMVKTERWGLRDMAFPIKRCKRAYYTLIEYAGPGTVSTNLGHQMNLIDEVVKFQTVKIADRVNPADLPETEEIVGRELPTVPPPMPVVETAEAEEGVEGEGEAVEAEGEEE